MANSAQTKGKNEENLIALFVVITLVVFFAGCVSSSSGQSQQTATGQIGTKNQETYTGELSALALSVKDLPGNWTLKGRGERVADEMSEEAKTSGWKAGYYADFYINTDVPFQYTVLKQWISVYPRENVSNKVGLASSSNDNETITSELTDPKIGDLSKAYKIKDSDGEVSYQIEFAKMDVYQGLSIAGFSTDYEVLKAAARKAADKVK